MSFSIAPKCVALEIDIYLLYKILGIIWSFGVLCRTLDWFFCSCQCPHGLSLNTIYDLNTRPLHHVRVSYTQNQLCPEVLPTDMTAISVSRIRP